MFLQGGGRWGEFIRAVNHEVRFPKGPPGGGRQAAGSREVARGEGGRTSGAEALSAGVGGLVRAGINFTWSDEGAPPRTPCGRDIFRVPHLVPPSQGSLPALSASRVPCGVPRVFFWGCGRRAEMEPINNWRGCGLHPSKERERARSAGVLCCGIIVP